MPESQTLQGWTLGTASIVCRPEGEKGPARPWSPDEPNVRRDVAGYRLADVPGLVAHEMIEDVLTPLWAVTHEGTGACVLCCIASLDDAGCAMRLFGAWADWRQSHVVLQREPELRARMLAVRKFVHETGQAPDLVVAVELPRSAEVRRD